MDKNMRRKICFIVIVCILAVIAVKYGMNAAQKADAGVNGTSQEETSRSGNSQTGNETDNQANDEADNQENDIAAESNDPVDESLTEAAAEEEMPESYLIEDFPIIYQLPELPTGCEITAMTMVLNYYGLPADKITMATAYLPTLYSTGTYYGSDGLMHGNDLNEYFIGDPMSDQGIACGTGAIVTAANDYLEDSRSSIEAVDMTGTPAEELYQLVSEDTPVVVWCTIGMVYRTTEQGWYTESGEYVDWGNNDHGAILIGYSPDTVTIADPLAGQIEYSKEQFEEVFASRDNRCVILQ